MEGSKGAAASFSVSHRWELLKFPDSHSGLFPEKLGCLTPEFKENQPDFLFQICMATISANSVADNGQLEGSLNYNSIFTARPVLVEDKGNE